jgi:ferredoxin
MSEEGKVSVINPKGEKEACAKEAAESCPVSAIKID